MPARAQARTIEGSSFVTDFGQRQPSYNDHFTNRSQPGNGNLMGHLSVRHTNKTALKLAEMDQQNHANTISAMHMHNTMVADQADKQRAHELAMQNSMQSHAKGMRVLDHHFGKDAETHTFNLGQKAADAQQKRDHDNRTFYDNADTLKADADQTREHANRTFNDKADETTATANHTRELERLNAETNAHVNATTAERNRELVLINARGRAKTDEINAQGRNKVDGINAESNAKVNEIVANRNADVAKSNVNSSNRINEADAASDRKVGETRRLDALDRARARFETKQSNAAEDRQRQIDNNNGVHPSVTDHLKTVGGNDIADLSSNYHIKPRGTAGKTFHVTSAPNRVNNHARMAQRGDSVYVHGQGVVTVHDNFVRRNAAGEETHHLVVGA